MTDDTKCKEKIWGDWHYHYCTRKAWKDGYCKQHHPDTVAERRAARDAKYQRESEILNNAARLRAAAPELLGACKAALNSIKKDDAYHIWLNYPNTPELTLGKMLESAIAKAEGKP